MSHISSQELKLLQQGKLDDARLESLLTHMSQCTLCQAQYMDAMDERSEELAEIIISDDFTTRTLGCIKSSNVVPLKEAAPTPSISRQQLIKQRLVAYSIAASLTLLLMSGGVFGQLGAISIPSLERQPRDERDPLISFTANAPLLEQTSLIPQSQQPLSLPTLRHIFERSKPDERKE